MTTELITFNHLRYRFLVQQHWELELVNESQLGEVQMKRPLLLLKDENAKSIHKYFAFLQQSTNMKKWGKYPMQ